MIILIFIAIILLFNLFLNFQYLTNNDHFNIYCYYFIV